MKGTGDFNADGSTDVAWLNDSIGQVVFWIMNREMLQSGTFIGSPSSPELSRLERRARIELPDGQENGDA